jgi:hypothetical protein
MRAQGHAPSVSAANLSVVFGLCKQLNKIFFRGWRGGGGGLSQPSPPSLSRMRESFFSFLGGKNNKCEFQKEKPLFY